MENSVALWTWAGQQHCGYFRPGEDWWELETTNMSNYLKYFGSSWLSVCLVLKVWPLLNAWLHLKWKSSSTLTRVPGPIWPVTLTQSMVRTGLVPFNLEFRILFMEFRQSARMWMTTNHFALVSFDELAKQSDFLLACCALTPETHEICNQKLFSKMKKNAILINTSR